MTARLTARLFAALVLSQAGLALGAPTIVTTRPTQDPDSSGLSFFIGGIDDTGRSLKPTTVELMADGAPLTLPSTMQPLSDWAALASDASPTWRPPLAVGLVYLWTEGVPSSLLDAIHGFFQRVPSRTPVHPTIYGRMRQGRARLTAAEIGRLDEIPYLDGHRPNLLDAVRLDLSDLASDPAPIKILLIVTDGRDYADPKGEGPGDFLRLGTEIRRAGVTPFVVAFPPPEADSTQAAANLRDLHEAAGGFLATLTQIEDLDNTLESLGQGLADLLRVEITLPWSWRTFGGSHRFSARLAVSDGRRLNADIGTVALPGGGLGWILLPVGLVAAILAAVFIRGRLRAGGGGSAATDHDVVLSAAHDLIRRGVSPERAVEELTRNYPGAASSLALAEGDVLTDPRFPYFRTRPGKQRLNEIRDMLNKKSSGRKGLGKTLAGSLAAAIEERTPPEKVAAMLAARVAVEEWTAFAGMSLNQLASALRGAAGDFPVLGTPRARGMAVSIQDQLRAQGGTEGILVGWLVRSGGPGRHGETLRLVDGRNVVGSSPGCSVRLIDDHTVAPEHAEIDRRGDGFVISPFGGAVRVEGSDVQSRAGLTDGETIELGSTFLVFKSASAGSMLPARDEDESEEEEDEDRDEDDE